MRWGKVINVAFASAATAAVGKEGLSRTFEAITTPGGPDFMGAAYAGLYVFAAICAFSTIFEN